MRALKLNKRFALVSIVVGVSLLSGCGSDSGTASVLNGTEYIVVSAGDMTRTATTLSGSGSVVIKAPLSELASKNSYRLTFTLQDGGTVSLVTNSTTSLTGGVTLKFTRTGTTLGATLLAGSGSTDVSGQFTGVDASSTLTYQVDVHNDESPSHILLWDSTVTSFTEAAARLNSEDAGLNTPGQGTGTYWGLVLSKATVTEAVLSAAKFVES
jgi:hypothetical protein